jgi:hypothetical protein
VATSGSDPDVLGYKERTFEKGGESGITYASTPCFQNLIFGGTDPEGSGVSEASVLFLFKKVEQPLSTLGILHPKHFLAANHALSSNPGTFTCGGKDVGGKW